MSESEEKNRRQGIPIDAAGIGELLDANPDLKEKKKKKKRNAKASLDAKSIVRNHRILYYPFFLNIYLKFLSPNIFISLKIEGYVL